MSGTIGATQLLDPGVVDDPYSFYRQLHAEAPVWRVPGTDVVVVSTFAAVAEATGRIDDFSNNMKALLYRGDDGLPQRVSFADMVVQTLATADPPLHTVHRATVFPELVAKRMSLLEPDIAALADECVHRAISDGEGDFMAVVGNVVPITMMSRLIGFRGADIDRLLRAAFQSTAMLGSTITMPRLEELIMAIDDIETWIGEQITAAADDPGDDLLGSIARGVDDDALSMQEGTIILHTLLSAGGESTTSLLGNAARILAEQPAVQAPPRPIPDLVPAFVEEVLRLESPFRYLMRSVPADTELCGVAIPADATVLLFWGAANRDAAEYDRPDDVELDRRVLRHHVAFGRGIHHCVGAPLALARDQGGAHHAARADQRHRARS